MTIRHLILLRLVIRWISKMPRLCGLKLVVFLCSILHHWTSALVREALSVGESRVILTTSVNTDEACIRLHQTWHDQQLAEHPDLMPVISFNAAVIFGSDYLIHFWCKDTRPLVGDRTSLYALEMVVDGPWMLECLPKWIIRGRVYREELVLRPVEIYTRTIGYCIPATASYLRIVKPGMTECIDQITSDTKLDAAAAWALSLNGIQTSAPAYLTWAAGNSGKVMQGVIIEADALSDSLLLPVMQPGKVYRACMRLPPGGESLKLNVATFKGF